MPRTSSSRCFGVSAQPEIRFSGLSSRLSTCGGCTYRRGSTGVAATRPPTHGPAAATSPATTISPAVAPTSLRTRSARVHLRRSWSCGWSKSGRRPHRGNHNSKIPRRVGGQGGCDQAGEGERRRTLDGRVGSDDVERARVEQGRREAAEQHAAAADGDLGAGEAGEPRGHDRHHHGVRCGLNRNHRGEQPGYAVARRVGDDVAQRTGHVGAVGGQPQAQHGVTGQEHCRRGRDRPRWKAPDGDPHRNGSGGGAHDELGEQRVGVDPPEHHATERDQSGQRQRNDRGADPGHHPRIPSEVAAHHPRTRSRSRLTIRAPRPRRRRTAGRRPPR